jgi:glucose/mannose-6-phosphate isomerase
MRALATGLPDQLRTGFASAAELGTPVPASTRRVVVCGMGGSAISGDLVGSLTDAESEVALAVARSPVLPGWVGSDTLAILASYSGNTWETLAAFREAGRRGAGRLTVGSGGRLREAAEADGVPHLSVPPGLPPRAAVGYLLGGLLGLLEPVFPTSNEDRFRDAVDRLASRVASLHERRSAPARLAASVGRRAPFLYAEASLVGLARRWHTQVEENAKRIAHFDQVPELFHNAIVGWDALGAADAARRSVVLLDWVAQSPEVGDRFRYLERLLRRRRVPVARVPLDEEDRLHALLWGIAWGDAFSLFLAERAGVDPYPVDAIERMKTALEIKRATSSSSRGP